MKKGPGKEDVADIFPHVATIAVVYGDPGGKYMAYLKKMDSHYMTAPYYYYDQLADLSRTSTRKVKSEIIDGVIGPVLREMFGAKGIDGTSDAGPQLPRECPGMSATSLRVQLGGGLFVTCEELKPFYGYTDDTGDGL